MVTRGKVVPMVTTEIDRFVTFADECVRFVQEIIEEAGDVDPFQEAQHSSPIIEVVTKKWTGLIIDLLYRNEQLGFSRLRDLLVGISSRTLSLRLKSLEEMGWVRREVVADRPPRVLYSLTEKGTVFAKIARPVFLFIRLSEGE